MFDNTMSKKLRKLFLFKYIFQLFISPLFYVIIMVIISIFIIGIKYGFDTVVDEFYPDENGLTLPLISAMVMYGINIVNILSLQTLVSLMLDCITRKEEQREIKVKKACFFYELQSVRRSKRFICDTFSRKKNIEIYLYDESNKKYRFLWNENYGGNEETVGVVLDCVPLRIKYLKYSKIITSCEVIEPV